MISNIQFLTPEGVNVTKRIEEGETFKFKERKDAEVKANFIRSYVYELNYYLSNEKGLRVIKQFGYAVPK